MIGCLQGNNRIAIIKFIQQFLFIVKIAKLKTRLFAGFAQLAYSFTPTNAFVVSVEFSLF